MSVPITLREFKSQCLDTDVIWGGSLDLQKSRVLPKQSAPYKTLVKRTRVLTSVETEPIGEGPSKEIII